MVKFDGKRLKKRRTDFGITLDNLAKLSGSSKSYIWELENSTKLEPSGLKIFLIAKALGVNMEYFYGQDDNPDDVKQAIVHLAHAVSSVIGTERYYSICQMIYPDFKGTAQ